MSTGQEDVHECWETWGLAIQFGEDASKDEVRIVTRLANSIMELGILGAKADWKEVQEMLLTSAAVGKQTGLDLTSWVFLFNRHSYEDVNAFKYSHDAFTRALRDGNCVEFVGDS